MSPITCARFTSLVHELVDGRLDTPLAAALRDHAVDCAQCNKLLAADESLVRSLDTLPSPTATAGPDQALNRSLRDLDRRQRRAGAMRWVSHTALLMLGLGAGLALSLSRGLTTAQPRQTAQPGQTAPHVVKVIQDKTQLQRQLARHVRSTEGLYQQVLQLKNPQLARPLLTAELKLSDLKQRTAQLARTLRGTPDAAYLSESEVLIQLVHHWVHHEQLSLKEIQDKLRASDLPARISALKKRLLTDQPLPEGLPDDPALLMYLKGRQQLHQGMPGWAVAYMKQFANRYPRHELSRGWKQALPDHQREPVAHDDDETQPAPIFGQLEDGRPIKVLLMMDDQLFELGAPQQQLSAFTAFWRAATRHDLLIESGIQRYKADDGKRYREVGLHMKLRAERDPRMLVALQALLKACGLHAHGDAFPHELSIVALDADFPQGYFPK